MANANNHRLLLWVDDDGPLRFLYEEFMLEQSGWKVRWASSVVEAMEHLRREFFDAVLLDQFLPLQSPATWERTDAWGGCRLLYWLRGLCPPTGAPEMKVLDECAAGEDPPREENRGVKVVIVSAFFDAEVYTAIKDLSEAVHIMTKPILIQDLIDYLR